jgi:hypothetical protein
MSRVLIALGVTGITQLGFAVEWLYSLGRAAAVNGRLQRRPLYTLLWPTAVCIHVTCQLASQLGELQCLRACMF